MYVRSLFRGLAALVLISLSAIPATAAGERAEGQAVPFQVNVPFNVGNMVHDVTLLPFTVSIFPAPPADVTLNITLGGTVGHEAQIIAPNGLTFGPSNTSRTFQLKSGSNLGTIVMGFSLSGTNAADYTLSKTTHTVDVIARFTTVPATGPLFMNVTQGDTRTITVTPSKPVLTDVTLSVAMSGTGTATLSTTLLTFPAGLSPQQFTLHAKLPGTVTLTLTRGGSEAARYGPPAPINFVVVLGNTQPGENVTVTPLAALNNPIPATIKFSKVTEAGQTRLFDVFGAMPPPPSGHEAIPGMNLVLGASSNAVVEAPVHVCPTYPAGTAADETTLRIFKRVGPGWVDVTISNDTSSNVICAGVPSLEASTFGIFRLNAAPVVGAITGPAGAIAPGVPATFSATFTDSNATDVHTGVWVENGDPIGEATITKVGGVFTATGELTFATGGTHSIYLVIRDGGQPAFSPALDVTVDAAPPVIESVTATPGTIWPPDSKMHGVSLTVVATDDGGTAVCAISAVTAASQNEKQTAFVVTGPLALQVKAFPNTVYTITVTCTDAVNRTATRTVSVSIQK